ncbi:MAG: hypothetical protein ACOYJC_01540 [Christensenellales bacterium]|jgi:uncharacterized protein YrrD
MKTASTVVKLPVVGVKEGEQIAFVKNLLVSSTSKKVEYLSVEHEDNTIIPSLISFKDILGIGQDYIVVQSAECIKKVYDSKPLIAAAEESLLLLGTQVLNFTGDILDTISDYAIDEKTGRIEKLFLQNAQEINGASLITLSAKFAMVDTDKNANSADNTLDESTITYLLDKRVKSDVKSEDGSFVIAKDTVLTQDLIQQAEQQGVLLQLTMEV